MAVGIQETPGAYDGAVLWEEGMEMSFNGLIQDQRPSPRGTSLATPTLKQPPPRPIARFHRTTCPECFVLSSLTCLLKGETFTLTAKAAVLMPTSRNVGVGTHLSAPEGSELGRYSQGP